MVDLLHEIWIEEDHGQTLDGCCLAGPDGDEQRRQLAPGARLVHTFLAGCYYDAMTVYHHFFGREPHSTEHAWDYEPYPAEWLDRQNDPATLRPGVPK